MNLTRGDLCKKTRGELVAICTDLREVIENGGVHDVHHIRKSTTSLANCFVKEKKTRTNDIAEDQFHSHIRQLERTSFEILHKAMDTKECRRKSDTMPYRIEDGASVTVTASVVSAPADRPPRIQIVVPSAIGEGVFTDRLNMLSRRLGSLEVTVSRCDICNLLTGRIFFSSPNFHWNILQQLAHHAGESKLSWVRSVATEVLRVAALCLGDDDIKASVATAMHGASSSQVVAAAELTLARPSGRVALLNTPKKVLTKFIPTKVGSAAFAIWHRVRAWFALPHDLEEESTRALDDLWSAFFLLLPVPADISIPLPGSISQFADSSALSLAEIKIHFVPLPS